MSRPTKQLKYLRDRIAAALGRARPNGLLAVGMSSPDSAIGSSAVPEPAPHRSPFVYAVLPAVLGAFLLLFPNSTSAQGPACANAEFRKGPSANLPDCRAYEQISPVDKNGGDVNPAAFGGSPVLGGGGYSRRQRGSVQIWPVSTDGSSAIYTSRAAFAGSTGSMALSTYIARRTESGWTSTNLTPPSNPSGVYGNYQLSQNQYEAFSPDLSLGVVHHLAPNGPELAPGAQPGYADLYLRDTATDAYTTVTNVEPLNQPPGIAGSDYFPKFQGASDDFSHVVFAVNDALTSNAQAPCSNCKQLYEWVNGQIRSVNVLPDSTTTSDASAGSTAGVSSLTLRQSLVTGAVSGDGSKIYWSDSSTHSNANIYVRVNGADTIPVGHGTFRAATQDGEHALYTSGGELQRFDFASGTSTPLTSGAQVQGVVGQSRDLSQVYFTAGGVLAPGAVDGGRNLYLYDDGSTTLIATLPDDELVEFPVDALDVSARGSYVTPNGRFLAFTSTGALTGYPTTPAVPNDCLKFNGTPANCSQVFYYSAEDDELTCASCDSSGAPPDGPSLVAPGLNQSYTAPAISADGKQLFFDSWDDLVSRDVNGQQDTYEWRPAGSGDCEAAGGCRYLISGGTDGLSDFSGTNAPLNQFVGASADGSSVFFTTVQQLVPSDTDRAADLYAARVEGGVAAQWETPVSPCAGDECQDESTEPPADEKPGSDGIFPGNKGTDAGKARCSKLGEKAKRAKKKQRRLTKRARHANSKQRRKLLKAKARKRKRKSNRFERRAWRCRKAAK